MTQFHYLGIIVLALLSLHLLFSLSNVYRRSRASAKHFSLQQTLLERKVEEVIGSVSYQKAKINAWNGWRKFQVTKIVQENDSIKSFYLSPHDGKKLPSFLPGQHLIFRLKVRGHSKPVIRCYSLSDSATESGYYRVTIRRQAAPQADDSIPNGVSSCYFHDEVDVHTILDVRAPTGNFYLDLTELNPVVLVAGGVGITPFLSMIETLNRQNSKREIWLFYALRDENDLIMLDHLKRISRKLENLTIHYFFEEIDGKSLSNYRHRGFVSASIIRDLGAPMDVDFFVCGPPTMMQVISQGLVEIGVNDDRVHVESFGSPAGPNSTALIVNNTSSERFSINFQLSDKSVEWNNKSTTLLEVAESAGVQIDSGCRAGSCGTCLTAVIDGDFKHINEPGIDIEHGSCLPCIAAPISDIKLSA